MSELYITHTPAEFQQVTPGQDPAISNQAGESEGGQTIKAEDFKVDDGSLPRDLVLKAIGINKQDFLRNYAENFGAKRAEKVRLAIDDIYSDISSGVAYGRLLNRNLKFNDGRVRDASGKADDPYRVATYFINQVLDATYPEYVKVQKKKDEEAKAAEEKLKADQTYSSQLLNRHFYDYQFAGDATPEMAAGWAQASVEERISAYRNFIASELQNLNNFKYTSGYADIEDARQRLLAADRALQDGDVSSADMLILGRAGIRGAMFNPAVATSTAAPASPQEQLAAEQARYAALSRQQAAESYAAWNNWLQLQNSWQPRAPEGVVQFNENANWKKSYGKVTAQDFRRWFDEDMLQPYKNWSKETLQLFANLGLLNNGNHLDASQARAFMQYAARNQASNSDQGRVVNDNMFEFYRTERDGTTTPSGLIVYMKTFNPNDGTVYIFDMRKGTYGKYYMKNLPGELQNDIRGKYEEANGLYNPGEIRERAEKQKSGGILKAAAGAATVGLPANQGSSSGGNSGGNSGIIYPDSETSSEADKQDESSLPSPFRPMTKEEQAMQVMAKPGTLYNLDIVNNIHEMALKSLPKDQQTTDSYTSDHPDYNPHRTEWQIEDYARAISAAADFIGMFTKGRGALATGAVSTVADLVGDIADEKMTRLDVLENLGNNVAWTAVAAFKGPQAASRYKSIENTISAAQTFFAAFGAKALVDGAGEFMRISTKLRNGEQLTTTERQYFTNYIREATGVINYAKARLFSGKNDLQSAAKDYKQAVESGRKVNYTVTVQEESPDKLKNKNTGDWEPMYSKKDIELSPLDMQRIHKAGVKGGQAKAIAELTRRTNAHYEANHEGFDEGTAGAILKNPKLREGITVTNPEGRQETLNYKDGLAFYKKLFNLSTGARWGYKKFNPQKDGKDFIQYSTKSPKSTVDFKSSKSIIEDFNKTLYKKNPTKPASQSGESDEIPDPTIMKQQFQDVDRTIEANPGKYNSGTADAPYIKEAFYKSIDDLTGIKGFPLAKGGKTADIINSFKKLPKEEQSKIFTEYAKAFDTFKLYSDRYKGSAADGIQNRFLKPYQKLLSELRGVMKNSEGGILSLYRKGGSLFGPRKIVRAQEGTALTWNDIIGNQASKWNVDVANAGTREYDTSRLVNLDFNLGFRDPWLSTKDGRQGGAYYAPIASTSGDLPNGTTTSTHAAYVRDVEGGDYNWSKPTNYYQQFTRDLIDYNTDGTINYNNGRGGLTELGVKFAHDTDSQLADEKSKVFKSDGTMNTEWSTEGTNANGRKGTVYKNAADYLLARRMDQILGVAHNGYLGKGIRYYRRDANGNKQYLDSKLVEANKDKGIFTMGDPEKQDYDTQTQTQWTDIEIKGPEKTEQQDGQKTDLDRTPGDGTELPEGYPSKKNNPSYLSGLGEQIASYLTGLPRIALLNHAAKKNLDLSRKRQPYQKIAPWYQRQVLNDNIGNQIANTAMAQTRNTAQRISSNSTDLRESAAVQLQGEATNAQTALQQAQRDNAYIERRRAEAEKIGDTNITNLTSVANDNRQLRWADREQKLQDEAIYNSKVANNWATWLAEKEYDFKRDMYKRRAKKEAWNMANLSITVDGKTYTGGTVKEFQDSILANDKQYQDDLAKVQAYYANPTDENLKKDITTVIARMQQKEQQTQVQARNLFRQAYANYKNFPYNKPTTSFSAKSAVESEREGGSIKRTTKTSTAYATEQLRQQGKDADRFMKSMNKLHDRNARLVAQISIPYVLEVMKIQK